MNDVERVLVQVLLPKDLVRQIDHLKIDQGTSRATVIEDCLRKGIEARELSGTHS